MTDIITEFNKDVEIELLTEVIKYNQKRKRAFNNNLPFEYNQEFERILQARYQKVSRIKKRLLYLILRNKYVWFCTFTMNDNYINKSDRTKRDKLKSVLYTHDFKIILNVDYGKKTERQHFHCILGTNIDMDVNQYFQGQLNEEFGWTKSLLCLKGKNDLNRLAKYIDKLTNHCVKASTKRQRMLYNFKGYDSFIHKDISRLFFMLDKIRFENVILLDKDDITGKIEV